MITLLLYQCVPFRNKYIPTEIINYISNHSPMNSFHAIFFIVILLLSYFMTKLIGKTLFSECLNPDSTIYVRDNIFWIYIACFFGYIQEFKLMNVPIWMTFRIMLKWPRLRGIVDEVDSDTYPVRCTLINKTEKSKEVSLVISDTYDILNNIPKSVINDNETWHLQKCKPISSKGSYKSYNAELFSNSASKISELSKKYTTINLFLSTSPYTTEKLIKSCFAMDGRDGFKHLNVCEFDSGKCFKFKILHKIY